VIRIPLRHVAFGAIAVFAPAFTGCGSAPPAGGPNAGMPAAASGASSIAYDEPTLRAQLALSPTDMDALAHLSRLLWDAKRHEDAVAAMDEARAAGARLPDSLVTALALHHDALGHADVADSLARVLEHRLTDWSHGGSAVTYLRLRGEEFVRSEAVARRALEANPSAANHNNLGIALLYAGRPVEAKKSLLSAVQLDPALPGPLYNLAIVERFYRFDDAAAREWFRRYRALSSEDPDGLAEILAVSVAAANSNETKETP
jgi:tetratricopeptide (TPR) repeat protein